MSSVVARLGGFAVALLIVFLGAYAVGSAVGPFEDQADTVPAIGRARGGEEHGG